ncbi:MGMT family protein [Candidatus Peregrinibacteria bacterium]|nr:MGMT family protein [Candidatus Peregrinibacteria bacterium]
MSNVQCPNFKLTDYQTRLQSLLLKIPKGMVSTYKELAKAMDTRGYRFIGQLLNKNQYPDKYPCYKIVKSDRSLGGFAFGAKDKIRRLKNDGISVKNGKIQDFKNVLFKFVQ